MERWTQILVIYGSSLLPHGAPVGMEERMRMPSHKDRLCQNLWLGVGCFPKLSDIKDEGPYPLYLRAGRK